MITVKDELYMAQRCSELEYTERMSLCQWMTDQRQGGIINGPTLLTARMDGKNVHEWMTDQRQEIVNGLTLLRVCMWIWCGSSVLFTSLVLKAGSLTVLMSSIFFSKWYNLWVVSWHFFLTRMNACLPMNVCSLDEALCFGRLFGLKTSSVIFHKIQIKQKKIQYSCHVWTGVNSGQRAVLWGDTNFSLCGLFLTDATSQAYSYSIVTSIENIQMRSILWCYHFRALQLGHAMLPRRKRITVISSVFKM